MFHINTLNDLSVSLLAKILFKVINYYYAIYILLSLFTYLSITISITVFTVKNIYYKTCNDKYKPK